MTEKVYGFRGEDIFIFEKKGKEHILVERIGDETISGNLAFELVPVVSIEWFGIRTELFKFKPEEKATKKLDKYEVGYNTALRDLLSSARKQARGECE